MNVIIIDDELESRKILEQILTEYCEDVKIVGIGANVEEGIKLIHKNQPDLVFLDVEMPDGTGFDLLKKFNEITFEVIFATGFDKYALNAIKFNCLDFILKPIDIDDVIQAVEKAKKKHSENQFKLRINNLLFNLNQNKNSKNKIVIPTQDGFEFLLVEQIIRLESEDGYTWIYLNNQTKLLTSKYLKEFENILEEYSFFRIHRTQIINMNHIKKYYKTEGGFVVMNDDSKAYISRRKKDDFLKLLFDN